MVRGHNSDRIFLSPSGPQQEKMKVKPNARSHTGSRKLANGMNQWGEQSHLQRQPRNPPLQQKVICSFTFIFWDPRLPCLISPPRRSLTIPECSPAYLHNYNLLLIKGQQREINPNPCLLIWQGRSFFLPMLSTKN